MDVILTVFPNLFWLAPPFLTNKFLSPSTMPSIHINTIFSFRMFGMLEMMKTGMSAKMHFTIKLNLVN